MNLSNLSKIGNYFLPNEISTFTILVHFIVRYKSCLNSLISLLELTMKYFKPQANVKVSPRPIWKRFNASWSSWPTFKGPTRQQVSGWGQINGDSTVLLVNVVNAFDAKKSKIIKHPCFCFFVRLSAFYCFWKLAKYIISNK